MGAAHVRTAGQVKGRGRRRIALELAARGVDRDLTKQLMGEVSPEDEAEGIARALLRKRVPPRPDAETRRRIFQHLLRRGFPADAITRALREHGRRE